MVKDHLIYTELSLQSITCAELVWIHIREPTIQGLKPLIVGSFYRPQRTGSDNLMLR